VKHITQEERWFLVNQLVELTKKEARHLKLTTNRLKALQPDLKWVEALEEEIEYAEMLDAFVSRFSRLQDTLGDKLLPALLRVSLEKTGSQLDNLLKAEKMGWISSAESWIEMRSLRNKVVHEYMDSAPDLLQALIMAIKSSELLIQIQQNLTQYTTQLQQALLDK